MVRPSCTRAPRPCPAVRPVGVSARMFAPNVKPIVRTYFAEITSVEVNSALIAEPVYGLAANQRHHKASSWYEEDGPRGWVWRDVLFMANKSASAEARAPLRIPFVGGGTDILPLSSAIGGYVLSRLLTATPIATLRDEVTEWWQLIQ